MKKKGFNFIKVLGVTCNLFIAATPLILSKSACVLFWGEAESPEILKEDMVN